MSGDTGREPASSVVMSQLQCIVERTENTVDRLRSKLTPVLTMQGTSPPGNLKTQGVDVEMPPYFSDIRGKINLLSEQVDELDAIHDRIEL